jgi:hypothetical protein
MKITQSIQKFKGLDLIVQDDDGRQKKLSYRWTEGASEILVLGGERMAKSSLERLKRSLDGLYSRHLGVRGPDAAGEDPADSRKPPS